MGFVARDKIPSYFTVPQQVRFWDEENECWIGGIAYCDEIICGHCGETIDLGNFFDLEDNVLTHKDESSDDEDGYCPNLMVYSEWVDLSEAIQGDQ